MFPKYSICILEKESDVAHHSSGTFGKTEQTITLDWYKKLIEWQNIVNDVDMYGGILEMKRKNNHDKLFIAK